MLRAALALLMCLGPSAQGDAPLEEGSPPDWAQDMQSWEPPSSTSSERTAPSDPSPEIDEAGESSEPGRSASNDQAETITGSLRMVGGYLRFPDAPSFFPERNDGFLATEARVIAAREFSDRFDAELNAFVDLTRSPGNVLAGTFATAGSFVSPYRGPGMSFSAGDDTPVRLQFGLDRARVGVRGDRISFDVGRFPVNYSVAQIFTPNDVFAPFAATAVNTIFKPGVDAARLGIGLGKLSSLELVSVMGWRESFTPSWSKSALLLRPSIVLWNFEWAALGGKVAERWIVGGSFQGDAGPVGLRGEGHVGFPDRDGRGSLDPDRNVHVRLSAGPHVNFAWRSATIGAEYAFFSDGVGDPAHYVERFGRRFPDDLPYLGRHYVAATAGLALTPLLRLHGLGLVNAEDGSGMAGAFFSYSIADEADLLVGGFLPWGARSRGTAAQPVLGSEFGLQPSTLFIETRIFF